MQHECRRLLSGKRYCSGWGGGGVGDGEQVSYFVPIFKKGSKILLVKIVRLSLSWLSDEASLWL